MLRLIAKNLLLTPGYLVYILYTYIYMTELFHLHIKFSLAIFISMKWQLHSASDTAQSLVAILSTLFSHYQCKFHLQILYIWSTKWLELFHFSLFPLPLTRISHHHLPSGLFPLALTISNLFLTKKIGGMLLRI